MAEPFNLRDVRSEPGAWSSKGDQHLQKQLGSHETGDVAQDLTTSARIPRGYARQDFDWFVDGRYFKIWAEDERAIHGKELIVMGGDSEGGQCIRVAAREQMPSEWQHFAIALDGPGMTSNRDPHISLEDTRLDNIALKTRYVMLDVSYYLSFGQHHYQDLGVLEYDSLQKLRLHYTTYVADARNVVDQVAVLDPRMKVNQPKPKQTPSISPYDMPLEAFPANSVNSQQSTRPKMKGYDETHGAYDHEPSTVRSALDPVSVSHQNLSASRSYGGDVQRDIDILSDPDDDFGILEDLHGRLNESLRPILQKPYAGQHTSTAGQRTFRTLVSHLQSIIDATERLVQEGVSGEFITLVVQDPSRHSVLMTVGIWICDLRTLMDLLQRQLSPEPEEGGFLNIKSFCASILRLLEVRLPLQATSEASAAYDAVHILCSVMAVGIISYAGLHCGASTMKALSADLHSSDGDFYPFPGIKARDGYQLMYVKCNLACLVEFTGGPIWAFTSAEAHLSFARFLLSLTLDHFVDLWGPVWLVPDPDDPTQVLSVHTAGGLIHKATDAVPEGREVDEEVHCHWTKARLCLRSSTEHSSAKAYLYGGFQINTDGFSCAPFSPIARLLIGAASRNESTIQVLPPVTLAGPNLQGMDSQLAIHAPRAREYDTLPKLKCYHSCKMSFHEHIRSQHNRVQAAGTSPSCYLPDTYSLGFSGGKWLALTGTRVYKRSPGVSYKDHIVTHVTTSTRSLIRLLSTRTGVEISACTLNAQRVSLWRALMIVHGKWIELDGSCAHDVGDPKCIMSCWELPGIDTSTWEEQLAKDNSPSNWAMLIKPVLSELITPLSYSGIHLDDKLYCALPNNEMMIMEEPLPRWTPLLRDTCKSAAFAVLSPRCLTHECWDGHGKRVLRKCQHSRAPRHRSAVTPMLNTAIFVRSDKFAKADLFRADEGAGQEGRSGQNIRPRIMARRSLTISVEDAWVTIEADAEHPQLASIQVNAFRTSLRQAAGIHRTVYNREYLKGDEWEDDVVAVVLLG